jgi:hypothetical protein
MIFKMDIRIILLMIFDKKVKYRITFSILYHFYL